MSHLTDSNLLLRQFKSLPATLCYRKVDCWNRVDVYGFADASLNISAGIEYGQTDVFVGLRLPSDSGDVINFMDWFSHK